MKYFLTLTAVVIVAAPAFCQRVTVHEGTNIAVTAAPDQSALIMDLQGSLWSLPFRGGAAKQITDPLLEPARPDYSPKGGLIAFEAYKGGTFHIWTMKPDGSGLHQVTDGHGDDREPRFSPDGAKIAFSSDRAYSRKDAGSLGGTQPRFPCDAGFAPSGSSADGGSLMNELICAWEPRVKPADTSSKRALRCVKLESCAQTGGHGACFGGVRP